MNWSEYWNYPIPRKVAMAVVIAQGVSSGVVSYMVARKISQDANKIIASMHNRIVMDDEMIQHFIEKADPATLEEIDAKLDFWRALNGFPIETDKQ